MKQKTLEQNECDFNELQYYSEYQINLVNNEFAGAYSMHEKI